MKKLLIICLTLLFACDVTGITGTNDKEPGKKVVLRLDPGPGNPRNSEGDFIALKGGRIMFVYTHYTGSSGSDQAALILLQVFHRTHTHIRTSVNFFLKSE